MPVKNGKARKLRGGGKKCTKYDPVAVEKLIVYGEISIDPETKAEVVRYPTYKELGDRFGASPQSIGAFSKRNNLPERRREVQEGQIQKQVKKMTRTTFDSARLPLDSLIGIIDQWVCLFRERIEDRTVRADSASDLATLLRVRELLLGRATQRTDHTGHVSLEAIQSTHTDWRARAIDAATPLTEGTAGHGESSAKALPAAREPLTLRERATAQPLLETLENAIAKTRK